MLLKVYVKFKYLYLKYSFIIYVVLFLLIYCLFVLYKILKMINDRNKNLLFNNCINI